MPRPARPSTTPPQGRPAGTRTFDPVIGHAFGKAVTEMRIAAGLSQQALGDAASIERAHIGRIERGERVPNFVAVVKIAAAFGCSVTELAQRFERHLGA